MEPEASSFLRIFAGCADWDSTLVTLLIASGQTPDKPQHLSEPASLRSDDIEFGSEIVGSRCANAAPCRHWPMPQSPQAAPKAAVNVDDVFQFIALDPSRHGCCDAKRTIRVHLKF
jgi:hypothetical protein